MLRISKLGDYAIVVMATLARDAADRAATARELADAAQLPLPTVAKVCKALARGGLLVSQRGKAGGYLLGRPASDISVAAIVAAIDGPFGLTDCSLEDPNPCALEAACPCRTSWQRINAAVLAALEGVRLDAMTGPRRLASGASLVRRRPPSILSRGARELKT